MTGEEIRSKREAAHIPQGWLAKHAGLSQYQLSKFESGERPLPPPVAETIGKLVEGIVYLSGLTYSEAMTVLRTNGSQEETSATT